MEYLIVYIFIYCNADILLNNLYLSKFHSITNNELIQNDVNFYHTVYNLSIFVLAIYFINIIKNITNYHPVNKKLITLEFVYIKYTLNILMTSNMTMAQYEYSRHIMWLFSTPLMLNLYCDVNNLQLSQINFQYHIIPVAINVLTYPYKNTNIFYCVSLFSMLLVCIFMRKLYSCRHMLFTNIYLFIWITFICIHILELLQLTDIYHINIYYSFADMISKMITCTVINDYNEKKIAQLVDMDLQSVQFISYMIKTIKKYKNDNAIITPQCNTLMDFTVKRFLVKIPQNTTSLEKELLKKILPFNFNKECIVNQGDCENINKTTITKSFNMICILFTDIVNYTGLAKKYDDTVIFQLLYSIYIAFDNIIKKYPHLQKIETIGDAYMVVGDIYRTENNHRTVVKEILLFALDIAKEIKTIETPDLIPLSIRIGINMGNVSVGVLGSEIPRLCVVGNAVNVASRLQSSADIDTIQISRHIYEQIAEIDFDTPFEIVKKENVFLKNIGSVATYNITPPPNR
jgi:class 3 adenylate cyclase